MPAPKLSELNGADSAELFKVLSSDARRQTVRLLQRAPQSIGALADALHMSRPSVARHVRSLCDAGLVTMDGGADSHGAQRVCRLRYDHITVTFEGPPIVHESVDEFEMPLGLYSRVDASPPCGLAGPNGIIGSYDYPQSFLAPERATAQFIWIGRGFLEYIFPNRLQPGTEVLRLELAVEIGSEIALHRIDAACDVTIWVNEVEIGTWTSLGGLGEKRGRLTPAWWWNTRTQYGMLKVWSVDADGSCVDGSPVSARTLTDLNLEPQKPITIRIGMKPDAVNVSAFNLFGRGFGNYEQNLVLRLHYLEATTDADETENGA